VLLFYKVIRKICSCKSTQFLKFECREKINFQNLQGSGSILLQNATSEEHASFTKTREDDLAKQRLRRDYNTANNVNFYTDWFEDYESRLRLLSPREIANLLGFPATFWFPTETIGLLKQYSMLGNSLHVPTVTALLRSVLKL